MTRFGILASAVVLILAIGVGGHVAYGQVLRRGLAILIDVAVPEVEPVVVPDADQEAQRDRAPCVASPDPGAVFLVFNAAGVPAAVAA
jgi:hypothetical protein